MAEILKSSSPETLNLSGNGIQDRGAAALAKALRGSSLRSLDFLHCCIGDEGAKALARALRDSRLTYLSLAYNNVGDEAMKAFAAGIVDAPLVELILLGSFRATAEGARALAPALKHSNLEKLVMLLDEIGDEGGQALLEGIKDSAIRELDLTGSGCRAEILQQIEEVLSENKARSLLLQLHAESDEPEWTLTFRTAAGTVAAALTWSSEKSLQELRKDVFALMKAGTSGFQLPDRHLRAHNLRIVRPDGQLLDDGPNAATLAQQLGDQQKKRRLQ